MTRYDDLPPRRDRLSPGGPGVCSISVKVKVVTPILGGGTETRKLDDVDIIRPATVRGHLRFWWRALHGHKYDTPQELYDRESALWGRAATDQGGRSQVDVRIAVTQSGETDPSDINLARTPGAYALWPAKAENKTGKLPAPRRKPGTEFVVSLVAPNEFENTLRNVLRAWLVF